jgi:DNA-directed RNA polymerase subunit L
MKTYIAEKSTKNITLGFKDANRTLITPLIKALNDDANVSIVRLVEQHPELCDLKLYVEVKKGKPEEAIDKAAKAVAGYYSSISK